MSGQRRRGPMGGHGPGMRPTEKAKDFNEILMKQHEQKKSIKL